jgi:integrase
MAIFKRGKIYWFHFVFNGEHVQKSTKQTNARVARQMEAAYRTQLAKGEIGLIERKPAPTLKAFAPRFTEAIEVRCAEKPMTISFYKSKLDRLLEYELLASAKLDKIDEGLIERYIQARRNTLIGKGEDKRNLSPASVNRELATLRRLLYLAKEWKLITGVPKIKLLDGERNREFVLNHDQERNYLDFAPQPLKDAAVLILDTGLRVGEAVNLEWSDVHLEPVGSAKYGYIRIRRGKTKNAKRNVSLTARVRDMLQARQSTSNTHWAFPGDTEGPFLATSLNHQHTKVRRLLGLSEDFVIHSLRHTMLTRLGEAGVDAFTIMRIAGHSSITVSQRYVHPSPESLERAFERLEALNAASGRRSDECGIVPATFSATVEDTAIDKPPVSIS